MAQPATGQPEISVTNAIPPSEASLPAVTSIAPGHPPLCPVCGAPLPAPTKGPAKRYCSDACRQRAHRRHTAPVAKSDGRPLTRDETVSRLCYGLKSHEGLRDGVDTLVRIVEDERARLQAMPLYTRQQIARRFLRGLGLEKELDQ